MSEYITIHKVFIDFFEFILKNLSSNEPSYLKLLKLAHVIIMLLKLVLFKFCIIFEFEKKIPENIFFNILIKKITCLFLFQKIYKY